MSSNINIATIGLAARKRERSFTLLDELPPLATSQEWYELTNIGRDNRATGSKEGRTTTSRNPNPFSDSKEDLYFSAPSTPIVQTRSHRLDLTVSTLGGLDSIDEIGTHPCSIPPVRSYRSNRHLVAPWENKLERGGPRPDSPHLTGTFNSEAKAKARRMWKMVGVMVVMILLAVVGTIVGVTLGKKVN